MVDLQVQHIFAVALIGEYLPDHFSPLYPLPRLNIHIHQVGIYRQIIPMAYNDGEIRPGDGNHLARCPFENAFDL